MPDDNTPEEGESTPEPAASPPAPSSPWANDLASVFSDPALQSQVDGFLREKIQPYVTKLEQESAENRNANRLWDDFNDNPVDTFIAVSEELFGDETKDKFVSLISGESDDDDNDDYDLDAHNEEVDLPSDVREAVEWFQEEKNNRAYHEELNRIKEEYSDVELDEDLFHPFVVAADGDFETAIQGYKAWSDQAKEKYGLDIPKEDDVEVPPTAIGSSTPGSTPPPTQEKYDSIDDALDAFFDEQKSPPVTVGNV